jgi:CheY-like chemotaxis protein
LSGASPGSSPRSASSSSFETRPRTFQHGEVIAKGGTPGGQDDDDDDHYGTLEGAGTGSVPGSSGSNLDDALRDWPACCLLPIVAIRLAMAKVLVVDDVTADAAAWSAVLVSEGHVVLTALDGIAAAQACDQFLPDLVVTDLELPGLDGLALIARLHARGADVGIIAISGSARALETAKALGVSAVLRKPIAMTDFIAAVRSTLPA